LRGLNLDALEACRLLFRDSDIPNSMHLPMTNPSGTCSANHNSKITAISCFIGRSTAPPNLLNKTRSAAYRFQMMEVVVMEQSHKQCSMRTACNGTTMTRTELMRRALSESCSNVDLFLDIQGSVWTYQA
jgi:hypothetical protein